MSRPSKVIYYLEMARVASIRSTCLKNYVGAVIVQNDQVVATGYNGAPRGRENCVDLGECYRVKHDIPSGTQYERCVDGRTPIMLADGSTMPIRDMARMMDKDLPEVLAYDDSTRGVVKVKPAWVRFTELNTFRRELLVDNFVLNCTRDHKIMVPTNDYSIDYRMADEISANDMVVGALRDKGGEWWPHMLQVRYGSNQTAPTGNLDVYDMEIPEYHNFGVAVDSDKIMFVHNCRSVHAEANAIIDADRSKMLNASMYIYQYDPIKDRIRSNPGCCMMCQRLIINAGINEVIFADPDGIGATPTQYGYRVVKVRDWVANESNDPLA